VAFIGKLESTCFNAALTTSNLNVAFINSPTVISTPTFAADLRTFEVATAVTEDLLLSDMAQLDLLI